ncbi:MAG: M1 family metallopeptidase [Flavobacterium sp.]
MKNSVNFFKITNQKLNSNHFIMRYIFLFFTSFVFAQQIESVDFKTINASLIINPVKRNVVGEYEAIFMVKNVIDTIKIDAQKMEFSNLKINGKAVKFKENKKELLLFEGFKKGKNKLTFNYEAFPTQTMYFVNWNFSDQINEPEKVQGQIWTQGQGKYTSHWLPSFDDVNEKVVFGLDITFHKSFTAISNGKLKSKKIVGEDIRWKYQMDKPMSSYLLMLAIGHFDKKAEKSSSKIPLEYYFEKEDFTKTEPAYRHSKQIFDFFEKEIGISYPWKIYRQIPVRDFLYAGMENTSATIFSRDYMCDSIGFFDRNYVNVNAHELAHQWFGDLITARSGKHHWLQEGFATYYALLAEKEVFGEDYFYNQMFQNSLQLQQAALKDTIPVLNEKASSLTYYQKGAWALHIIYDALGREKFNKAIKNYLKKYAYKNVSTDDFLAEIKAVSDFDTETFKNIWLEKSEFPIQQANYLLRKNKFMNEYFELLSNPKTSIESFSKLLKSDAYYPVKVLALEQMLELSSVEKETLFKEALATNDLNIRQAVASIMTTIPESFRTEFETLLQDASYETQEKALFKLWKQFPEHRLRYLEISKNWIGFQNKNLRLLHLSLAFLTTSDQNEKVLIYKELLSYTGTDYDSTLQQAALGKLLNLKLITPDVMKSLAYGAANPRWQFVKFSKDSIRKLLKEDKNRAIFTDMIDELPIREKTILQRLLDEK